MNIRIKRQNAEDKENELKLLAIQLQGSKSEFEKKCDEREKSFTLACRKFGTITNSI